MAEQAASEIDLGRGLSSLGGSREARNCLHLRGRAHRPLAKVNAPLPFALAHSCLPHETHLELHQQIGSPRSIRLDEPHSLALLSLSERGILSEEQIGRIDRTGPTRPTETDPLPPESQSDYLLHTSDCNPHPFARRVTILAPLFPSKQKRPALLHGVAHPSHRQNTRRRCAIQPVLH